MKTKRFNKWTALRLLGVGVLLAGVIAPRSAWAHIDPPGCQGNFLTMGVRVFRADGTTEIAAGSTVSPCETIQYQATVAYFTPPTGTPTCAFQGGDIFIKTP